MYSATFAMTVIIGTAIINLLLGFAAAVLMGRGPKRWSDIERAIVLQPIALGHLRPAARPTVERVDLNQASTPTPEECDAKPLAERPLRVEEIPATGTAPAAPTPEVTTTGNGVEPLAVADTPTVDEEPSNSLPPNSPEPNSSAPREIVLAPKNPTNEAETQPPEKTLNHQLDTWRHGELGDEAPSISGIKIDLNDCELDPSARELLMEAVYARIKSQVRKDRRVLKIESGQFAWFSCDVPPDDALMPIERIRQMLTKTQFHHQGNPIPATVVASVVVGLQDDHAEDLLKRLHTALQYALESQEHATCLDTGRGPEGIAPYSIEVEETECELAELQSVPQ